MANTIDIAIPSKNELFLQKTILDVVSKTSENVHIYPVLDGYEPPEEEIVEHPRVHYIRFPATKYSKKRQAVNAVAQIGQGDYIMSMDAHCMIDEDFDTKLLANMEPDMVMVPRRHRLDAENWSLQTQVDDRPPIDYEYLMWPKKFDPIAFHGFKWDKRTLDRWDIPVDDIITFQGSCWLMSKEYFKKHRMMDPDGYQGWGQEAEELSFKTWMTGGRVVVNKNTWYAHLHKGPRYGRMYFLDKFENRASYAYCWDFWINNKELPYRVHNFDWLVEKFWPLPGWPNNWREELGYEL